MLLRDGDDASLLNLISAVSTTASEVKYFMRHGKSACLSYDLMTSNDPKILE